MYAMAMVVQVVKEMGYYRIKVVGISECRCPGLGKEHLAAGEILV